MLLSFPKRLIFVKTKKTAGTSLEVALENAVFNSSREPLYWNKLRIYPDGVVAPIGVGSLTRDSVPGHRQGLIRGTSLAIRHRLNVFELRRLRDHSTPAQIRRVLGDSRFSSYTKMTSVRNPYDVMASAYFYAARDCSDLPNFRDWVTAQKRQRVNAAIVHSMDGTWRIVRFENLEEDFSTILTEFGIQTASPLPRFKSEFRPDDKRDYRDLYDSRSKAYVKDLWADWFEAFGYAW